MKKINTISLLSFALLLLSSTGISQTKTISANDITGLYWSPKKDAKIEIYQKGDRYFGKSVWIAKPRKDTKNPKEALKSREVLGIYLLSNFSYDGGTYSNGEIYDPESGKTYDCKMSLDGNKLRVRGYIGISLFGRTEIFERIK
jgi:uncharacterized protein (DUF2147 family)